MARRKKDGFAEFCEEQGWPDHIVAEARKIATSRIVRNFPPFTEEEWIAWAKKQMKPAKWR